MKKDLEEITVHEVNRIGFGLENDLALLEQQTKTAITPEIQQYINVYIQMITQFNSYVKTTNQLEPDHIVKYYKDPITSELSYTALKKPKVGF